MEEEFLHYIWKFRLYEPSCLITQHGETVEVLQSGMHNTYSGPDFTDARIRIGQTLWAGNVEIHTRASDWQRHGHSADTAYQNVVLHVVAENDYQLQLADGSVVPTLVLRYPEHLHLRYQQLKSATCKVPCQDFLPLFDPLSKRFWFDKLAVQRIADKSGVLNRMLELTQSDWEESFYQFVARSFGFGVNNEAFEMLAKSLPQRILAKHRNSLLQIEALLFGQAGFLEEPLPHDAYYSSLQTEYAFLRTKFDLSPVAHIHWTFMRLRPVNFPTVRIAQFASLIYKSVHLFSRIIAETDLKQLTQLFDCEVSEYWLTHYTFKEESAKRSKHLGKQSAELLVVNAV
jgi:hypothetical protein